MSVTAGPKEMIKIGAHSPTIRVYPAFILNASVLCIVAFLHFKCTPLIPNEYSVSFVTAARTSVFSVIRYVTAAKCSFF